MVVNAVVGADEASARLREYCSGLPDVEKKIAESTSPEGAKLVSDFGIGSVPMVVILDEDSSELFRTADIDELEKFFS
ncbi:hypothetical protein TPCCA_0084 [Treponema paraluiscuniculi Cuniculi A]|uniref:Thioredoxin-like fold domain-containing protein n=2 Tax=Treponema paraluiscuniculi TaxID=53435 RepID=F7XRS8_TREPU|nr:hypothetical protein [Treponema paraluiscuniculi]AEH40040.1 hypothetical protein TPCCA_0084 [Treponema paraluiscuniculi Cuniculi A]WKC71973.1 hypothetical protein TPLL2_0084 [Treponema paraluiscuniculi]